MKPFWDNHFHDMDHCGVTREQFAERAGKEIRDDIDRVLRAIQDHEPKKAMELIAEMKKDY
jgi:uncharacterized protein YcaQ